MARGSVYPEVAFGGFSSVDGTVHLLTRAHALSMGATAVLDVGCGRGLGSEDTAPYRRGLRDFRRPGRHVLGIDVDQAAASNPFIDEFRIFSPGDSWPVVSGSIDFVFSDNVLEHVGDPAQYFEEVHRVLRRGGFFVARTPSVWSYPILASRLIPNALHAAVLRRVQSGRREEDVFPTVYRANSRRRLRRLLVDAGLEPCVYSIEPEPSYMQFSRLAFRAMALVHQVIPSPFRSTLVVLARKS
jgi:SAM-dependent methyltransferase